MKPTPTPEPTPEETPAPSAPTALPSAKQILTTWNAWMKTRNEAVAEHGQMDGKTALIIAVKDIELLGATIGAMLTYLAAKEAEKN